MLTEKLPNVDWKITECLLKSYQMLAKNYWMLTEKLLNVD